jgi:ArsR family transcriptional regulator, lead/cadmium/zinc/bismuth-responsive transcriptional repressor
MVVRARDRLDVLGPLRRSKDPLDCVAPDRSPSELAGLRRALAAAGTSLRRLADHHALLAGESRLKILALLRSAGELCVCDLATVLDMTPAAVSQHLSRLRGGGLVASRRDGMMIYYRLAEDIGDTASCLPSLAIHSTPDRL